MTTDEQLDRILAIPLIAKLPESIRDRVGRVLLEVSSPATLYVGEAVFVEGDEDEHTGCVLLSGEVEVLRGHEEPVRCPAPDLFGEMQQLEATAQRTATVQATYQSEIRIFNWHDFVAEASAVLNQEEQAQLRDAIKAGAAQRRH
jgi:CRP-like cAMP-binding protein